jgi:hypothetical protein
MSREELQTLRE